MSPVIIAEMFKFFTPFCLLINLSISVATAEPRFAVLAGLSGDFAPMGEDVKRGFELAASLNAAPSDIFLYEDTQANVKLALSAYEKVAATKKLLAVYAIRSPIGLALRTQTTRDQMPLLGGVAHTKFTKDNKFAFGIWATSKQEGQFLASFLHGKKLTDRACIITSADEWLIDLSESLKESLKSYGNSPVLDEIIEPTEMDLRSLFARAKSKHCSMLFLNVTIAQYAPALKRLRETKLGGPVIGNFWLQKPEVLSAAGKEAVEGVLFAEMQTDIPEFLTTYRSRFNNFKPTAASVSGFVAGMLLLETSRLYPEVRTSAEFYSKLLQVNQVGGLGYTIKIVERAAQFPLTMNQITDGKIVRAATP